MLMNIENVSKRPTSPHPILNLGFRVFFVGSGFFAILTMLLWAGILTGKAPFSATLNPFYWHGHEMVFGYALAVIAGFLLTAVKTWTNQPMPYGYKLLGIFMAWLIARFLWLGIHATPSPTLIMVAFVFDMAFWGLTSFFVIHAVYLARQKRQIGIVAKLVLLLLCQLVFYVGIFINHLTTQKIALYFALYLVIGVVFTIARRVLPFFISKGVGVDNQGKPNGTTIEQKNSTLLDRLSLIGLTGFVVFDLFVPFAFVQKISAFFALLCVLVNLLRLSNWYHHGIWQKPLLWSLVIAFFGMTISMGIFVVVPFVDNPTVNLHSLGLHGLALFGIGLMTVAMMARVALGHTGRNIHTPPKTVGIIFVLMIVSGVCRVFLPMMGGDYMTWVLISQIAWILSFALFCVSYVGILSKPRIDGLFG